MGDTSMLSDLEHLVSPFVYSPETRLPDVERAILPRNKCLQGFISEDCKWGCYYNNSTIQCYSLDTKISDYHYVPKSQSHASLAIPTSPFSFMPRSVITCATELAIHRQRSWSGGVSRILIGLDCSGVAPAYNTEGCEGAVAIYDQIQQQIIKWIPLPEPVTTVKVVSHHESSESIKPFFNGAMMAMVGIAAVGMKGGKVIVLDLGLDKTEFVPSSGMVFFSSVASRKQSKPFMITDVDPFERLIATNRHNAIRNNQLISFTVGDPSNLTSQDIFTYTKSSGSPALDLDKDQVEVTAIDYVPNIGCLLIGFSFGGFQMWKVDDLSLQFSADVPEPVGSVRAFGFQQPVDDPKNFCYLWALYGTQTYQMARAKLDLYQLFFLEKTHVENFGFIYNNLHKCGINLSIALEDVFMPPDVSESTEEDEEMRRYFVHPLRLWIKNELLFVSWNVTRSELFYVGIFDLNQWYSSHTAARIPSGGLCPFWVAIPVEPPKPLNSLPWDFRLVPSTLQRWENQFKQVDIHYYPASITFQGICLTMRGYYTFEHFGIQEKIIRLILKEGHTLLAEPGVTREFCYSYGLQPFTSNAYEPESLSEKDVDRFYIFTAILESKRPALIVKMANAWVDGSFTNVGCTVDLIIEWIRDLSLSVRYSAEQHWDNVFNLTAERMLPETKKFLVYSNFIWNSLLGLLSILVRHDDVYNVARESMLDDLRFSLEKLVQYSAALLMFYQADILPTNNAVTHSLLEYHEQRRVVVQEALQRCDVVPEDVKKNCFKLVIDQMISSLGEDFVRKEWNLEPEDPLYPPPHSAYVVNMIMWRQVDVKLISRVIFYFLIDFLSVARLPRSKLEGDFAAVIHLSPEEQQDVYNLWHVDHGYFDGALTYMSQNPSFNGRDECALTWSTAVCIMSAFKPPNAIAELFRMGCPPYLGKLYISVLGRHKLMYKKLLNDICVSAVMQEPEILRHFFQVAMERQFLAEFINTKVNEAPLTLVEELVGFLEKQHDFEHRSLLLSCYIKMENIDAAAQVFRMMKACWGEGVVLTDSQREIWAQQQRLMSSPDMSKKHNAVMDFLNMKRYKQEAKPSTQQNVVVKSKRMALLSAPARTAAAAPAVEMSPLRRYAPKPQSVLESPDDSLNGSSIEGEKPNGATPGRRSTAFDVNSVLKTPNVDHRKTWREGREDSMNNSLYETPPPGEDMHSILKKTDGSIIRSKSILKTRFMDPTSGKELISPSTEFPLSPSNEYPLSTTNVIRHDAMSGDAAGSHFSLPLPFEGSQIGSPSGSVDESLKVNVDSDSCDTESDRYRMRPGFDLNAALLDEEEEDRMSMGDISTSDSSDELPGTSTTAAQEVMKSSPVFLQSSKPSSVSESPPSTISDSPVKSSSMSSSPSKPPSISLQIPVKLSSNVSASSSKSGSVSGSPLKLDSLAPRGSPPRLGSPFGSPSKSRVVEEKKTVIHYTRIKSVTYREEEVEEAEVVPPPKVSVSMKEDVSKEEEPPTDAFAPHSTPAAPTEKNVEVEMEKVAPAGAAAADETVISEGSDQSFYFSPTDESKRLDQSETEIPETPAGSRTKLLFEDSRVDEESVGEESSLKKLKAHDQTEIEISVMHSPNKLDESSIGRDESSHDESVLSTASMDTTADMDLGPRRLTRRQNALIKSFMETTRESPARTPKASPAKEKSPARSTRSKRGKSEEASSVASSEESTKMTTTTRQRRSSRRSETPESDASTTSQRPLTRSQKKKLETSRLDTSGSPSSIDSSSPEKKAKTTRRVRGKTPVKSLMPIFEEDAQTKEPKEKVKVSKPRALSKSKVVPSRAQSEPPVATAASTASAASGTTTPRKRRGKVFDFAPELSTVLEVSDNSVSVNKTPSRREASKRRRPSVADSLLEEDEPDVLEASVLDTSVQSSSTAAGPSKRSRRSVTPSSSEVSDVPPPRRRRRASSVK